MATAFCLTFGAFLRDWQRFALQELSGDMTGPQLQSHSAQGQGETWNLITVSMN
jgi:hypothetical protein